MSECWKPIPGYEGVYDASDLGRIKRVGRGGSAKVGRILKPMEGRRGYLHVMLSKNGHRKLCTIHRLVLLAFEGEPPDDKPLTRHLDGNRQNNCLINLTWGTAVENQADRIFHGTSNDGEQCHLAKLNWKQVIEIRILHASGVSNVDIARRFHVDKTNISCIVLNKTWKSERFARQIEEGVTA